MLDLSMLDRQYPMTEFTPEEYKAFRLKGIKFRVRACKAQGLGHVCAMEARAPFGLMTMESIILLPKEIDMPLFSIDIMTMPGRNILIFEVYNTLIQERSFPALAEVKAASASLRDHTSKPMWYDAYLLPETVLKEGTKADALKFAQLSNRELEAFLAECKKAPPCSQAEKKTKNEEFVEKMVSLGGVSSSLFLNAWGPEKGGRFLREIAFGTS